MNHPKIIWGNVILMSSTFLISVFIVPIYGYLYGYDKFEVISTILFAAFSGFSITAGYHRLWSHKSYKAKTPVKFFFLIGGALAVQGSALHFASDHRMHHKFVDDNQKDPYSAKLGLWYSHIGWILRAYPSQCLHDYKNVLDLQKDLLVMWQHKYINSLSIWLNFSLISLLGWLNGNVLSMLLLCGIFRLTFNYHCTFFVNSIAHKWGKQPYTINNTSKDSAIVALLTYGEGYHNFHHAFERDYRNGIGWYKYDPSKWLLNFLSIFGLVYNIHKTPEASIMAARKKVQEQIKSTY